MCVEVWVQPPLAQPPLVQQWRPRITMAAIITVPRAGIIRIRPAIELHRDADKARCVISGARRRAVEVQSPGFVGWTLNDALRPGSIWPAGDFASSALRTKFPIDVHCRRLVGGEVFGLVEG
jgi:hypothetical protein